MSHTRRNYRGARAAGQLVAGVLTVALMASPAYPCSVLAHVHDGEVFLGNNEDYFLPGVIWFEPGRNGRYGRVNVGFDTAFAQGGMNEAGLAFDATALPKVPWKPDPGKKTPANLPDRILRECATVEEALAYFERFNCRHLADSQFLFADATGDAAVVAWLPDKGLDVRRIDGDRLIVTNTRLGFSGYRCPRWTKADQILAARGGIEAVRDALDASHQRGPATTTYSTVYDLKRKRVRVYHLSDFSTFVDFDLVRELQKGRQSFEMAALFETAWTLDALLNEAPRQYDTRIALPPEVLSEYAGRYQPEGADVVILIRVDGADLIWSAAGDPEARLFPESESTFRIAPDEGQVSFQRAEGRVTGLTLHRGGDGFARRLSD